jgi:hypothetical protein
MLSANARSSTSPACDTTPAPSPVTSSPFSQPVSFTLQVLLDLGSGKDVDIAIVPGQDNAGEEHFS